MCSCSVLCIPVRFFTISHRIGAAPCRLLFNTTLRFPCAVPFKSVSMRSNHLNAHPSQRAPCFASPFLTGAHLSVSMRVRCNSSRVASLLRRRESCPDGAFPCFAIADLRLPALFLCQAHISPHCVATDCPFGSHQCPFFAGQIISLLYRYLSEHCCSVPFLSNSIQSLCASIRHGSLPFSVHGCSVLLRVSPSLSLSLRRKASPLLMLLLQKSRALFKGFAVFLLRWALRTFRLMRDKPFRCFAFA